MLELVKPVLQPAIIKTHDSELRGQEEIATITRNIKYVTTE